jgi:hypothetical protein
MSVVELSPEQVVKKVGFDLKINIIIIIMVWLCVWPGCECHISLHCHFSYYLKPVMNRV